MPILQVIPMKHKPKRMEPPYTQDSIQRALDYRRHERMRIAREMGIPSDLVDLVEVFTIQKVGEWMKVLAMLSAD